MGWGRHVFPSEDRRGSDLPADRRVPARGQGGAPARGGDRENSKTGGLSG